MAVTFEPVSSFPQEQLESNAKYSESLGLPSIEQFEAVGPLAIVGGGPSINNYKYTLQSWPGNVWAINRTYKWCKDNHINAVFFSFDPNPSVEEMVVGAEQAILGDRVDTSVYERLQGKRIWRGEGNLGGTTSVGAAIISGFKCGFESVTLFGCESSYQPYQSHAYAHFEPSDELVIWVDGMHFITSPQMLMAAIELSQMIKSNPHFMRERSGGLLRAMLESPTDYQIVGCTQSFQDKIDACALEQNTALVN